MDFLAVSIHCDAEAIDLGVLIQKKGTEARLSHAQMCFMFVN